MINLLDFRIILRYNFKWPCLYDFYQRQSKNDPTKSQIIW